MSDVGAPLSSVQATLDDATDRVAELASTADGQGREGIAMGLWEVERSLRAALRRLEAVRREL
ncbi:MAG TPA: hypothetical protein VMW08_14765 [Acidimicrobiales bacterium]|nr:hypothetical protein [Acidimicrobiales bacterium]